jgi:hypothetical protein
LTASAVTGTRRPPDSSSVAATAGAMEVRVPNKPVVTATQVGVPVRSSR